MRRTPYQKALGRRWVRVDFISASEFYLIKRAVKIWMLPSACAVCAPPSYTHHAYNICEWQAPVVDMTGLMERNIRSMLVCLLTLFSDCWKLNAYNQLVIYCIRNFISGYLRWQRSIAHPIRSSILRFTGFYLFRCRSVCSPILRLRTRSSNSFACIIMIYFILFIYYFIFYFNSKFMRYGKKRLKRYRLCGMWAGWVAVAGSDKFWLTAALCKYYQLAGIGHSVRHSRSKMCQTNFIEDAMDSVSILRKFPLDDVMQNTRYIWQWENER